MSVTLALLAAHTLGDFPLQSDWMATEKFDNITARASHCAVHLALTAAFLSTVVTPQKAVFGGIAVGVLHFIIDTKRWAEPKDGFDAYPIAVDQSLHVWALFGVSVVIL